MGGSGAGSWLCCAVGPLKPREMNGDILPPLSPGDILPQHVVHYKTGGFGQQDAVLNQSAFLLKSGNAAWTIVT